MLKTQNIPNYFISLKYEEQNVFTVMTSCTTKIAAGVTLMLMVSLQSMVRYSAVSATASTVKEY